MFNFFNGMAPQQQPTKKCTQLYTDLGVSVDATSVDIRRAYRALAMKHHPDKGGTDAMFKTITAAYEVLSDDVRRKRYDTHGTIDADSGMEGMHDIFSSMFARPTAEIKPIRATVRITLSEVYTGCKRSVVYQAMRSCKACAGKGGSDIRTCGTCHGQGLSVRMQQIGPGMVHQVHVKCVDCAGRGRIIRAPCTGCKGACSVQVRESLDLEIRPLSSDASQHVVANKGHEVAGSFGPVVISLAVHTHALFTRHGNDLHLRKVVHLADALDGCTFTVEHLNGTQVSITSTGCIQPESVQIVPGMGMTSAHALHVTFTVLLPLVFKPGHRHRLVTVLEDATRDPPTGPSE